MLMPFGTGPIFGQPSFLYQKPTTENLDLSPSELPMHAGTGWLAPLEQLVLRQRLDEPFWR